MKDALNPKLILTPIRQAAPTHGTQAEVEPGTLPRKIKPQRAPTESVRPAL